MAILPLQAGCRITPACAGRMNFEEVSKMSRIWKTRADLVLLCAIVMAIADPLRVTPQIFNDLYGGVTSQSGHHLIIGAADWAALLVFALIRPELWSIVAMLSGLVLIITAKIIGLPALPGWTMMMVPWLLVNWRHVTLTHKEKRSLVTILPAVFSIWAALILTGHVVDPAMQGQHSIGWVYATSDEALSISDPVQVKVRPGVFLTRRIASIEGERATLSADNANFGEIGNEEFQVDVSKLHTISWATSPKKLIRGLTRRGRFLNLISFESPPKNRLWSEDGRLVAINSFPNGFIASSGGRVVARFPEGFKVLYLAPEGFVSARSSSSRATLLIFNPTPGLIIPGRKSKNYNGGVNSHQSRIDEAVLQSGYWTYYQYSVEQASPFD